MQVQMVPIAESKLLRAYGYEQGKDGGGSLHLEFRDGRRWRYDGVPPAVLEGFLLSESRGSYFHRAIKGRFPGVPLEP